MRGAMAWTLGPTELARLAAMKRGQRPGVQLAPRDPPAPVPSSAPPPDDYDRGYWDGVLDARAHGHDAAADDHILAASGDDSAGDDDYGCDSDDDQGSW
jgi:hypothetical protein